MLTWMGIVGKLIELVVTKVVGAKIDLVLDDKRRAAKAFVRFHESVITLEGMLDDFLKEMEMLLKDKNFQISHINNRSYINNLKDAAREFVDSMEQLGNVLYFYDKNLANQFKKGLVSKMDVLHNIHSMFAEVARKESERDCQRTSLRIKFGTRNQESIDLPTIKFEVENKGAFNNIKYTIPSESLLNNFDKYFTKVSQDYSTASNGMYDEMRNYQSTVLEIIKNNVEHGYIVGDEKDKALALYSRLKKHKKILTEARESLRKFIKEQFTLDEILSVIK